MKKGVTAQRARKSADAGLHWQSAAAVTLFKPDSASGNDAAPRPLPHLKPIQFQRQRTVAVRLFSLIALALMANFAGAQPTKEFPTHWGKPPEIQTHDFVALPDGYGRGSSTLRNWIVKNLEKDKNAAGENGLAKPKPLFENSFENAEPGKLPDGFDFAVGSFAVKSVGTNKFLELAETAIENYSVQFGPVETDNVAVSARILGTTRGRRVPTFGVGLGGIGGFKMQVAPGKKTLELLKDQDLKKSVAFEWKGGAWTNLRLQIRKLKDGQWKIEGKAWVQGTAEPKEWMLIHDETEEPLAGKATVMGSPQSGTPIEFDDLAMERVTTK